MEIIIVTYNNEETIKKCLDSISNQIIPCKITVKIFDNNSTDNTVELLKKYIPPKLNFSFQYFKNINNIGFGKACNYYAKQSNAEVILFMNPDIALISDNILSEIYSYLTKYKFSATALGATHKDYDNNIRTQGVVGNINKHRDRATLNHIEKGTSGQCLYISGGFLAIRNDTLKSVNYFDEDYFMYFEDFDLCMKLHSKYKDDCRIINLDNLYIRHKFQGSKINREERMSIIRKSKEIFENRWKGCQINVQ